MKQKIKVPQGAVAEGGNEIPSPLGVPMGAVIEAGGTDLAWARGNNKTQVIHIRKGM